MERLTEWVKDCPEPEEVHGVFVKNHDYIAAAHRLAEYEDTGLTPDEVEHLKVSCYGGCPECRKHYRSQEVPE